MDGHDFIPGLCSTAYVFEPRHALLARDAGLSRGPNVGARGENLTIVVLSLNRAALTVRLLESVARQVPRFAGEVLLADNGSEPRELETLRAAAQAQPFKVRILELGSNFGVGGGRNRAIAQVQTDWVLSLDNDIYLVADPLERIQKDIAVLGCHFLNVPLLGSDREKLFAKGGHLYVDFAEANVLLGAGSACKQEKAGAAGEAPFLSTFLFGGASVINRHTFQRLGGFDEAMLVGFEDIDFSIRLFQEGFKVGNTACAVLVHDHPPPACDTDRDYERNRFARAALERSARHLEAKHGVRVWNQAVDEWLKARQQELGLIPSDQRPHSTVAAGPVRTKVALVIDTDGWAFSNIARQLVRHLSDRFEFLVIPMDVIDNVNHVLFLARDCDIVHFFWREHARLIGTPHYRRHAEQLCGDYSEFHRRFVAPRILSTAVYDHLMLGAEELRARRALYDELLTAYYVSSERLRRVYDRVDYPAPAAVLEDGVDLGLFGPKRLERLNGIGQRDVIVGWAGNSRWASELEDFKGLHTILLPAVRELQAEGLPIRTSFADRAERMIPHREMPSYYAGIDVYVCPSKIEGTPNPVLESMACGVPVITTDVGVVPEAFGPLQKQFILEERSVPCLKAGLRRLVEAPALFRELSRENLERIKPWDWSIKAEGFARYFQLCLDRRDGKSSARPEAIGVAV